VNEPTAPRLLTLHNVAWTFALVDRIRAAVVDGTLDAMRAEVAAVWGPGGAAGGETPATRG
jgi:queuine tRNA-ribosyltransferase